MNSRAGHNFRSQKLSCTTVLPLRTPIPLGVNPAVTLICHMCLHMCLHTCPSKRARAHRNLLPAETLPLWPHTARPRGCVQASIQFWSAPNFYLAEAVTVFFAGAILAV
eukprot:700738-Amorphochlora_amoeboformis.AAC.1